MLNMQLITSNSVLDLSLLPIDAVCQLFGIKHSCVYQWVERGQLPHPVKLSPKCSRWPADELRQVVAAFKAGSTHDQIRELVGRIERSRADATDPRT
jgi:predicted DNA-binding transcriptional regulator AlpA